MRPLTVLLASTALCLTISSCGSKIQPTEDSSNKAHSSAANSGERKQVIVAAETAMQKWVRSCSLCHVSGEGGAPISGKTADWEPRLLQGKAVLLKHTIEGYNNMPPLGYCMSCDEADFVELIDFMSGQKL